MKLNYKYQTLMKYYIIFFLFFIFLLSCSNEDKETVENISTEIEKPVEEEIPEIELFEREDILAINRKIAKMDSIVGLKEIMELYYPYETETNEGNEKITITEKSLEHEITEVTLIHDNLMDDSMKAIKYIMLLKQQKGKWTIISIKKNWKCRKGRGHAYWGIDLCE